MWSVVEKKATFPLSIGSPSRGLTVAALQKLTSQLRGIHPYCDTTARDREPRALDRYHTPPKEPLSTSKIPYFLPKQSVRKTPMSTDMPVFAPCLLATRRRAWLAYPLSMASEPALTRTRAARAWGGLPTNMLASWPPSRPLLAIDGNSDPTRKKRAQPVLRGLQSQPTRSPCRGGRPHRSPCGSYGSWCSC